MSTKAGELHVASIRELPASVADVGTTLGALESLLLTHSVGRLVPAFRAALESRHVALNPIAIGRDHDLLNMVWPRGRVVEDFTTPVALASRGLARRVSVAARDQVTVVVGEKPRDFLLFHGLSRLRPDVFWLPTSRLDSAEFVDWLAARARRSVEEAGRADEISVVTAESDDAATHAAEVLNARPGMAPTRTRVADWRNLLPRHAPFQADPRSERRTPLLRHEGATQGLPTPIPVGVTSEDPFALRWMVDIEVEGWSPARHRLLGAEVLRGVVMSDHDARTSSLGPSYFGLAPFQQAFLGLEESTARPRLRPLSILEQVSAVLTSQGWQARLSDKGAFALHSARLFDGVEGLATALRRPPVRQLLDAYLTPTTTNDPGRYLKDTRRRYLTLAHARDVIGGGADTAAAVASDLYSRGALLRGHLLKCEHCRSTSFYVLNEQQEFTCLRCRTRQRATRFSWLEAPEPEFHYALSEVLFQFLSHNGDIPLLAALDRFVEGRGQERAAFDIAFELQLISPSGDMSEHDIIVTWGTELWIGEATIENRLGRNEAEERDRLRRLKEVADTLSAEGVLLATAAPSFRAATRRRIERTFHDPVRPQVQIYEPAAGAQANADG